MRFFPCELQKRNKNKLHNGNGQLLSDHEHRSKRAVVKHLGKHALCVLGATGGLVLTLGSAALTVFCGAATVIVAVAVIPTFGLSLPLLCITVPATYGAAVLTGGLAGLTGLATAGIFHCEESYDNGYPIYASEPVARNEPIYYIQPMSNNTPPNIDVARIAMARQEAYQAQAPHVSQGAYPPPHARQVICAIPQVRQQSAQAFPINQEVYQTPNIRM